MHVAVVTIPRTKDMIVVLKVWEVFFFAMIFSITLFVFTNKVRGFRLFFGGSG